MKIILVSSEQYQQIREKLPPHLRATGSIPHPSIMLYNLNALIVLNEGLKIGPIEAFKPEPLIVSWLTDAIANNKFFEVG